MTDATQPDDTIDALVGGLIPVKPLRNAPLWIGACIGVVLAAVYIFFVYGPRPELRALSLGVWTGKDIALLKPLMFLVLGLSAVWSVTDLARPEGRLRMRTLVPLIAISGLVVGGLGNEFGSLGTEDVVKHLHDPMLTCFVTIFCGGMVGLIVLWRFWLRRSATSHPVALGTMSGLATASLMAAAYAVHCDMDAPIYIVAVYGVAVAVTTGVSALIGSRIFRW